MTRDCAGLRAALDPDPIRGPALSPRLPACSELISVSSTMLLATSCAPSTRTAAKGRGERSRQRRPGPAAMWSTAYPAHMTVTAKGRLKDLADLVIWSIRVAGRFVRAYNQIMTTFTATQARQQFFQLLDAAEDGGNVVLERRGTRFRLVCEAPKKAAEPDSPLVIQDPALLSGNWTWSADDDGQLSFQELAPE